MRLIVKLQSVSDIITNSSSEVFQIQTDMGLEAFKEFVSELHKQNSYKGDWNDFTELSREERREYDSGSGMGGILEFKRWEEVYESEREWHCVRSKYSQYTPEIWALGYEQSLEELKSCIWLDIDQGFVPTIKYVIDNFNVVGSDYYHYWKIDPETGKRLRIVSVETWKQLPENERFPKDEDGFYD